MDLLLQVLIDFVFKQMCFESSRQRLPGQIDMLQRGFRALWILGFKPKSFQHSRQRVPHMHLRSYRTHEREGTHPG